MKNPELLIDRFEKEYDRLVEETGNPETLHNYPRNKRLQDLLELFEYLRGDTEENPMEDWFSQE